jgi:hypothetical protein
MNRNVIRQIRQQQMGGISTLSAAIPSYLIRLALASTFLHKVEAS